MCSFPTWFCCQREAKNLKILLRCGIAAVFRVAQLRGEAPTANVEQSVPLPHEWTAVLVLPPDSNVEHFADGANGFEENDVGGLRFCFASDVKARSFWLRKSLYGYSLGARNIEEATFGRVSEF